MLFPARSTHFSGTDIASIFLTLQGEAREQFILAQVENGCVPDFMRSTSFVELVGAPARGLLEVLPDYLCLGTDEDYIYAQCNIRTAQRIADVIDAMLPTKKIVDAIWSQAPCKLEPTPQGKPYDHTMRSSARLVQQSRVVIGQKALLCEGMPAILTAGAFKDYILVPGFAHRPGQTCIYGWHRANGRPIQDPNLSDHDWEYLDYSHCPRFVAREIRLGDDVHFVADVLASRTLHTVVTGTEPSKVHRVPGV